MDREPVDRKPTRQQRPGHETPPLDPVDDLAMPVGNKSLDEEQQQSALNRSITPPEEIDLSPATQTPANSHIHTPVSEVTQQSQGPTNITPSVGGNELVDSLMQNLGIENSTPASGSLSVRGECREIENELGDLTIAWDPSKSLLAMLSRTTGLQYHQRGDENLQGVQPDDKIRRFDQHMPRQLERQDSVTLHLDQPDAQPERSTHLGQNLQPLTLRSQVPASRQDQPQLLLEAQQRQHPEPQYQHQQCQNQPPPGPKQKQGYTQPKEHAAASQYQQQYSQSQHHVESQKQQQFNLSQHPVPSHYQQQYQKIARVPLPPIPLAPASPPRIYNSTVNGMNKVNRSLWNNDGISKVPPPAPGTFFAPRDPWFARKYDTADAHADMAFSPPRDRDVSQPHRRNLSQSTDQDLSHHGIFRLSPEDDAMGRTNSPRIPKSRAPGLEQHPHNPSQPRTTGDKQHAHNPSQPKIERFENHSASPLPPQASTQLRLQTASRDAIVPQSKSGEPASADVPIDFSRSWPPPSRRSHLRTISLPIRPQGTGFKPMYAVTNTRTTRDIREDNRLVSPSAKFSVNYAGVHSDANASCDDLPEHLNAAVWLTNLPPDITFHELLLAIRGHGRVWCSYINQPDFVKHNTAAAKIVFFEHTAAHRLLKTCWSTSEGLTIRGHSVRIDHNRIKNPSVKEYTNESRCLIITGESWFVNEESLRARFNIKFVYQVDEVIELYKGNGRTVLEFRFGSWRNQAQMGKMSLEKDHPAGFEKAEYGEDPCETGREGSYDIAALRARGIEL